MQQDQGGTQLGLFPRTSIAIGLLVLGKAGSMKMGAAFWGTEDGGDG